MTGRRSVNIYDYPEHLNPFFEDDNHTKLRFWTNTKRKPRSNSFSFQSIKDFKQSLFSRPARKRSGTSSSSSLSQLSCYHTHEKNDETPQNDEFSRTDEKRKSFIYPTLRKLGRSFSIRNKNKKREVSLDRTSQSSENDAAYSYTRSTLSNRQTMPSEMHTHTHRADVTPLPRIRFHERVRNLDTEKCEKTEKPASPTDDTNPFKDEADDSKILSTPSTSKPTTPPRKKKRAPPPPPMRQSSLTRKSLSAEFSLHSPGLKDKTTSEINHKDVEQTEENITRTKIEETKIAETKIEETKIEVTKIEVTKIENENPESKIEITKTDTSKPDTPETDISETNISKTEIPKTDIPKIEITKVETEIVKPEVEIEKLETEGSTSENPTSENPISENPISENQIKENKETTSRSENSSEEMEPFELNYNSELNISSSEISVSSETRLELQQHLNAVEDSSDLLELVQKLQLEVEKLTDDTNNNVITPNFDSGKRPNFYGYDDEDDYTKSKAATPLKNKAEININLDDDDDVVTGAPLSPRLVRLRKDHEWIKH